MRFDGTVRSTAAAGAAAAGILAALMGGGSAVIPRACEVCVLAAAGAVLCASVFFYVQWHIGGDPCVAWLVTVTGAYALQKLNWSTSISEETVSAGASVYALQILVVVGLGSLLVHGDRLPVRWDPLALGLLIGLAVICARIGVLEVPVPPLSSAGHAAVLTALGLVGLSNAWRLLRSSVLTVILRRRLALAAVFLTLGQVSVTDGSPLPLLVVGTLANVVGSALLVATAVARTRSAVADEAAALRVLRNRLERVDHDLHTRESQLHEIRSTLAGIATATELQQRPEISPQRREQLHRMTLSELHRLDRLTNDAVRDGELTELDATLRPIILRHETDGLRVTWRPSGHVALTRSDDVAEIVSILLANTARHAPGATVRVAVQRVGPELEISVADDGPGVDPAVLGRLFTWGAHGPRSPGQGVGLATARLLAGDLGGRLELAPGPRGTRFVLSLPAALHAAPQGVGR